VCAAASNVAPTFVATYGKGRAPTIGSTTSMARQITCECGQIVRGETEAEVVELTREHLRSAHPQLADKLTRDDIVALIEIVD